MANKLNDPLLMVAKGIIYFIMGVITFAGFFVLLGIPAMLIFGADIGANINGADMPQHTSWLVALLLCGVAGILVLGLGFFRNMLRIVQSVGEGDPFAPENADRLTAMAWLTLVMNVLILPIAWLGIYVAELAGEAADKIDADLDFGGIVLILTLFILARVFKHGAAMRDDLEGTV